MTPQDSSPRIFVTGATGQLGRKVVDALLQRVPPPAWSPACATWPRPRTCRPMAWNCAWRTTTSPSTCGSVPGHRPAAVDLGQCRGPAHAPAHGRDRRGQGRWREVDRLHQHPARGHLQGGAGGGTQGDGSRACGQWRAACAAAQWLVPREFRGTRHHCVADRQLLTCAGDGRFSAATRADYAAAAAAVLASPAAMPVRDWNWRAAPVSPCLNWPRWSRASRENRWRATTCHRRITSGAHESRPSRFRRRHPFQFRCIRRSRLVAGRQPHAGED